MRGVFVTFEGPEGAGKSTQARRLAASLAAAGFGVTLTREPGGTPLGDRVRSVVLLEPGLAVTPLAEFLLYSASRAQLVTDVIRPALEGGGVVVCDRYVDSSLAYQGGGRGLPAGLLREVSWAATGGLRPHVTVLLDLDASEGLRRAAAKGRPDRLEGEGLDFHHRVRATFLELAQAEPERFLVLDATADEEALAETILATVSASLGWLTGETH